MYKQKYLKYKNKYILLKKQVGGNLELEFNKIKDLVSQKLPKGKYTIHIKMLSDGNEHKICHHYSFFSLYDIPIELCCNQTSQYFLELLKPEENNVEIGGASFISYDYKNVCNDRICDATKILNCNSECEIIDYPVRLYNFKEPGDTEEIAHSSRFENGLWWHKLNGRNCLFSIIESPDLNYTVQKEVIIKSYKVPQHIFKDSSDEVFIYSI